MILNYLQAFEILNSMNMVKVSGIHFVQTVQNISGYCWVLFPKILPAITEFVIPFTYINVMSITT